VALSLAFTLMVSISAHPFFTTLTSEKKTYLAQFARH
jgi:hypothetical protein